MLFFQLSTWLLATLIAVILVGATSIGLLVGRAVRDKSDLREPFSVMQGALLGFMGLVLAFGLSLAVGRYEARRAAVVDESNAIGTTYLRAQSLAEPQRTQSLALLKRFADTSIQLSRTVPGSADQNRVRIASGRIQRQLWALAGESLNKNPTDSAPRLYVDSLNEMFDSQSSRIYSLGNRIPTPVLVLEIAGPPSPLPSWRSAPGRSRWARRLHGDDRGGAGGCDPARHLRPRPADARSHPGTCRATD